MRLHRKTSQNSAGASSRKTGPSNSGQADGDGAGVAVWGWAQGMTVKTAINGRRAICTGTWIGRHRATPEFQGFRTDVDSACDDAAELRLIVARKDVAKARVAKVAGDQLVTDVPDSVLSAANCC